MKLRQRRSATAPTPRNIVVKYVKVISSFLGNWVFGLKFYRFRISRIRTLKFEALNKDKIAELRTKLTHFTHNSQDFLFFRSM